jgi:hypothetical protein
MRNLLHGRARTPSLGSTDGVPPDTGRAYGKDNSRRIRRVHRDVQGTERH